MKTLTVRLPEALVAEIEAESRARRLGDEPEAIIALMRKYADVPISPADASLVRMTEILPDPVLLTTDADFRIYRRHSCKTIPCVLPD